jgi:hypothetical protein
MLNLNITPFVTEVLSDQAPVAVMKFSSLQSKQPPSNASREVVSSMCREQSINAGEVSYAQKKVASVRRLNHTSLPIPSARGLLPAKRST